MTLCAVKPSFRNPDSAQDTDPKAHHFFHVLVALAMLLCLFWSGESRAAWGSASGFGLVYGGHSVMPAETPDGECTNILNVANQDLTGQNWTSCTLTRYQPGDPSYGYYNMVINGTDKASPYTPRSSGYFPGITCPSGQTGEYTYKTINGCVPLNTIFSPRSFGCQTCGHREGFAEIGDPAAIQFPNDTNMSGGAGASEPNRLKFGRSAAYNSGPADSQSGNAYYEETDYTSAGPNRLTFTRYYNSQDSCLNNSSFGGGWRHSFDRYLVAPGSNAGALEREDGKQYPLNVSGTTYSIPNITNYTITAVTVGSLTTYTVTTPDDSVEIYTANSLTAGTVATLQSITYRNGYSITLDRSVANVLKATDSYGRVLTLNYNATTGLLTSVNTPDITTINYGYGTGYFRAGIVTGGGINTYGRLASVTYPDAPSNPVTYSYTGTTSSSGTTMTYGANTYYIRAFMLSSVTDQQGHVKNSWVVDPWGRVTSVSGYNGLDTTSITYNDSTGTRTVTTPSGVVETYSFTNVAGLARVTGVDRAATATTPADTGGAAYDGNGYVYIRGTRYILPYSTNNRRDFYTNNARGLPTQVIEAYDQSAIKRTTNITYATATAPAPYPSGYTYQEPLTVSEGIVGSNAALRTTTFTYDTHGNMLTKTVHDGTAAAQPDRVWTYTYDSLGNVLTVQDPRLNTTTFTYTNGSLATVTDALSHTTTFSNFTAGGRPRTITDPNGTVYTITYDARQRVATTAITVAGVVQTTTYAYRSNGELLSVTYPDSTNLTSDYAFENAGASPLTFTQTDATGNKTTTTLNADNKPTKVQTLDPSSTVYLHRNKTYDALGRVLTETNFDGTKVTTYTYDVNGNVLTVKDGNNHTTTYTYDYLNRRLTATDANSGVTTYNYNALDQVTSIVAPGSITTSFTYDAFGDVMTQVSPDTGTTTYTYDKNSNVLSKTDAITAVTNYTYDVLNRLATVAYPANSALNITLTYDESGHGKGIGHLTSGTDAPGTISRSYDERGSLTSQARVIGGQTYNIAFSYNAAGRLATLTYPSGALVTYTRDTAGNISSMAFAATGADSTSVFTAGTYLPFGPVKALTFNDGITETLAYDHDLNLSTQNAGSTGSINLTYAYDNANNLSSVTDAITAANTQTFGYDVLNRLTSAVSGTGGYGTQGWTYNANGNLLTTVNGGVTTTFTTTANTNRITAATATGHSWSYGYTAAGNTNSVTMDAGTPTTQAYGVNNRLASQTSGATTVSYIYGAAGERASKTASGTTTKYLNDPAGHLMMEAATGTTPTTEYIYLGDRLVAQYAVAANKLLSVHTDRIGSPFLVTNKLKATQWTATYQPYGATQTTTNPGTITQNVRLPGMQQDAEFGNIHNGFRDYYAGTPTNPLQDHYPQADLIGLRGGLNPYRYARANPLRYTDRKGLQEAMVTGWMDVDWNKPILTDEQAMDFSEYLEEVDKQSTRAAAGATVFKQYWLTATFSGISFCASSMNSLLHNSPVKQSFDIAFDQMARGVGEKAENIWTVVKPAIEPIFGVGDAW